MSNLFLVILLGILIWNVKQGFEMIDEKLQRILEVMQKDNKNDCN